MEGSWFFFAGIICEIIHNIFYPFSKVRLGIWGEDKVAQLIMLTTLLRSLVRNKAVKGTLDTIIVNIAPGKENLSTVTRGSA